MTARREQFFILDPSLADFRGHHFMLTDIASRSAEAAGMEAVWLVSKDAASDIERANVTVKPWFSATMYDAYKRQPAPPLFKRAMRKLTGGAPAPQRADGAEALAGDLARAMEEFSAPGARFFAHTADGHFYRALKTLAPRIGQSGAVFHICTPYDPAGIIPNKAPEGSIAAAIEALKRAGLIGRKIYLHAENPHLAEHLTALWKAPVHTLEIPFAETASARSPDAIALRARLGAGDDTLVIASLGPARLEKGFHLIPDIIRRCKEFIAGGDYLELAGGSIHFALHAAPQIIGRDPVIKNAIDKIETGHGEMATVFSEPMSTQEYQSLLGACDIVLMPYDAEKYRVRGSGVVVEALGAGKIIVASEDSYPAKRIADGAGLSARAPIDFARAICRIASERDVFTARAAEAGRDYVRANSVEGYVEKLLAAEGAKLVGDNQK